MKCRLLAFFLFSTSVILAQGSWNLINIKYNKSPKLSFFAEAQLRSLNTYDQFHYYEYKAGANYKITEDFVATLAAGKYETYKEGGNFVTPKNVSEFRIWPQLTLTQKLFRLKVEHRYRGEFRFTDAGYRNRIRYRLGLSYPFGKERNGVKPFQLNINDELFFTNNEPFFQKNRLWASMFYRFSKKIYVQLGYVHQTDYKINDETGKDFIQVGLYIEF